MSDIPPIPQDDLGIPPPNDDLPIPPIKEETFEVEKKEVMVAEAPVEQPKAEEIKTSKTWFEISNDGWRRLNAGRSMSFLIREGISNVLDLEDATLAEVTLEQGHVIICDNSKHGFSDPSLITTVFMTDKEDQPTKRGRKGRGLKELISAADRAIVETIGLTIEFDKDGRKECKNTRTVGTKVEIWSSLDTWKNPEDAIEYLKKVIPPENLILKINGKEVRRPDAITTYRGLCLETQVIVQGVQKNEYRITDVVIRKSKKGESWLFEMGVPIQKIVAPWHVDVQQRVPLNDNRDTVSEWYLKYLFGQVLKYEIDNINSNEIAKEEWVIQGMGWTTEEVKKRVVDKITDGKLMVIKTENRKANDVAAQHGYSLLDVKHMAASITEAVAKYVKNSEEVSTEIAKNKMESVTTLTDDQKKFAEVIKFLSEKVLERNVEVDFFIQERDHTGRAMIAHFKANEEKCFVSWNTKETTDFSKPLCSRNLGILCHELAHNKASEHDMNFVDSLEEIAGKLAMVIFKYKDQIPHAAEQKVLPTKSLFITCIDCGAQREVKPQDVHQVKRCVECQKKSRRKKTT